ncbi:MAG: cytochrome d ubiquinol oxidase subunit II [Candidatus Eisenbacteria bacterium]
MEPTSLQIAWFLLIAVLIGAYAILDGFDLGVGILYLFRRNDRERRHSLNAIGPFWDGNEVWLVTGGAAIFAAFPPVYATAFSALYLALLALLAGLITRAAAIEFRGKDASARWRSFWDWCFGLGSLVPALLFGVAVGNVLRGIPIGRDGLYTGTFFGLLNPYALFIGSLSVVMFACHGALYLALRSADELRDRMLRWASRLWIAWVLGFGLATVLSAVVSPWLFDDFASRPQAWLTFAILFAAFLGITLSARVGKAGRAFACSSVAIAATLALAAFGIYPRMIPSLTDPRFSLTIANASASQLTLKTMLIIAAIGMPIVIGYTIYIYRVFRGKTEIPEDGY